MYNFGSTSKENLKGVHPYLVEWAYETLRLTTQDFQVFEGLRTLSRQRYLYSKGTTRTLDSYHLRQKDGYGHAVDLVPWVNGKLSWNWKYYYALRDAGKQAAKNLGISDRLTWGGDWKSFKDGPHWQLKR